MIYDTLVLNSMALKEMVESLNEELIVYGLENPRASNEFEVACEILDILENLTQTFEKIDNILATFPISQATYYKHIKKINPEEELVRNNSIINRQKSLALDLRDVYEIPFFFSAARLGRLCALVFYFDETKNTNRVDREAKHFLVTVISVMMAHQFEGEVLPLREGLSVKLKFPPIIVYVENMAKSSKNVSYADWLWELYNILKEYKKNRTSLLKTYKGIKWY